MTSVQMVPSNKFGRQIIKTLWSDHREDKRLEFKLARYHRTTRRVVPIPTFFALVHICCPVHNSIGIPTIRSTPGKIL